MYERFSDSARKTMQLANQEAQRFSHELIGAEHVLLGLVKQSSTTVLGILESFDVDPKTVRLEVEKAISPGPGDHPTGRLAQSPPAKQVVQHAVTEADMMDCQVIDGCHLLLGLLRTDDLPTAKILKHQGLELESVREAASRLIRSQEVLDPSFGSRPTPNLNRYGFDVGDSAQRSLVSVAAGNFLPPCPGRENELRQLHVSVNRATLNGLWLVGHPSDRTDWLLHTFGSELRSQSESTTGPRRLVDLCFEGLWMTNDPLPMLKKVAAEASDAGDIVLLIRHVDSLILGSPPALPSYLMALQHLASTGVPLILTATPAGCDQLVRRSFHALPNFSRLNVKPAAVTASQKMLRTYAEFLTQQHQVIFSDAILAELMRLAEAFQPSQRQPGVGIQLMESIASAAELQRNKSDDLSEPGPTAASYDALIQAISDISGVNRKRVEEACGDD